MFKLFLACVLMFPNNGYAKDPTFLESASITPYAGYLFSEEKTEELRVMRIEHDGYKLLNESLSKSIEINSTIQKNQEEQLDVVLQHNLALTQRAKDAEDSSTLHGVLWFGAGMLTVLLSAFTLHSISK